jgi:hypothetical protein
MRPLANILVVLLFALSSYTQTDDRATWISSILNEKQLSKVEHKNRLAKFDFGPLWTRLDNSSVFGFIGDDYRRLRIKIVSAVKHPSRPNTYTVTGKSMVKNVIRPFSGTISVTNARVYKHPRVGVDDEYKGKVKENGVIVGKYHFFEDPKATNTGSFDGIFATYWYVDRTGRLRYDDIEAFADGYLNNQFAGTWTSYSSKAIKVANWGDHRIPLSGDLDSGAGEFSPVDKYLPYGWQSYRDAYFSNDKWARQLEERQWWK